MNKSSIRKFVVGIAAAFMLMMPAVNVYAEDSIPVGTVKGVSTESSAEDKAASADSSESGYGAMQRSEDLSVADVVMNTTVTTEDLFSGVTKKMYEIADGIRAFCIPITVITFVFSVLAAIFGAISKRNTALPGIIGAGISIIAFTLIYNAPAIIIWGSKFLTS